LVHRARDAEATRLGSRALFYSALLALLINLVAPAFVATAATRGASRGRAYSSVVDGLESGAQGGLGDEIGSARVGGVTGRVERGVGGVEGWMQIPEAIKVNLASLWAVSHLVLGLCLLGTLLVCPFVLFQTMTDRRSRQVHRFSSGCYVPHQRNGVFVGHHTVGAIFTSTSLVRSVNSFICTIRHILQPDIACFSIHPVLFSHHFLPKN
jgi:hypothetical protein